MTDKIDNNKLDNKNILKTKDLLEVVVTQENPNVLLESQVGGTVDKDFTNRETSNSYVVGSPEYITALKAKIDELKSHSEQLERERKEASKSVSEQINTLVKELSRLDHNNGDPSENNEGQTVNITEHAYGPLQNLEIISDDDSINDRNHHFKLMRLPKVRQYWHNDTLHREAEERKVGFTELFWDLIFVAVIGNLGNDLVKDISGASIERFILTFYPIYKLWLDMTVYMNRYSSDDLFEKIFLLFEMVLVITMGTHASDIFQDTKSSYLISYVIARMAFVLLHLLYAIYIPLFRTSFMNSVWGIFIPCLIWIVAIFVPGHETNIVMWIAITFEIMWTKVMPLYNRLRKHRGTQDDIDSTTSPIPSTSSASTSTTTNHAPHRATSASNTEHQWKWKELFSICKEPEYRPALNIEHYSERLGLFAIIALGEGVLGVLYTSLNQRPDGQLGKAILGLLIAYDLHWIYFIVDASKQFQHALRRHIFTGLLFGSIHFPMNMALIAFGASLGAIVKLRDFPGADSIPTKNPIITGKGDSVFPSSLSWLYCIALAVSLYCMAIIGMVHKGIDDDDYPRIPKFHRILLRFIIGTIYLLLPLIKVNSLNLVVITSMLSLLLVVVETYGKLRSGIPLFEIGAPELEEEK